MKKRYAALGAVGALTAVNMVRAARFVPEKVEHEVFEKENVNPERYRKHLSEAIRIKTISHANPEETDWAEFDKFREFLLSAYPLISQNLSLETVGRANLIFRWKGKDPSLDPIALLSHQDVVPLEDGTEDDWTHPAFDGFDDGEFIWGRGALDMKNHLIAVMEAVETLLEEGFEPERDVYLLFGENEEVMSTIDSGAMKIVDTLKSRGVHLDSVLDEGGAMLPVNIKGVINNKILAGIGIAEKGYADFEISVRGKGGHSSQAPKHTAIGKLADVIKDIENHQFKANISENVFELFSEIGKNCTYPARLVTCNLRLLKPVMKAVMTQIPPAASFVRTTTGITMAEGSPTANVLPQKASITANFRMMPGTTVEDVEKHIKKVVRNKDIEVKLVKGKNPSSFSPTDSRCFNIIKRLALAENENAIVAPFLVMGGTDAYHYQPICENIYRYAPFRASSELLLTTHGTNERLPVECVEDCVAFFKRYVRLASGK
ncbi:MAG: M20/M25/M40 family metallo-hydrolase [Acutalibacteraceae bacterium]|nr:M20/M25/M40 family metallo-hydrolase [Oscillospiraceae bacterium]